MGPRARHPRLWWALTLLVLEYVVTTLLVDARELAAGFGLPGLRHAGELMRGLVLVGAATALYGGPALLRALREHAPRGPRAGRSGAYLVAHLLSFAALAGLTVGVGHGAVRGGPALFVAWAALGVVALALLLRFALPPDQLRAMGPPLGRALGAGTLAGGAAWAAGHLATFLWPRVSGWTLTLAALQLRLVARELTMEPEQLLLGAEGFEVLVAPVCSGLEGVGLAVVLASAYVIHFRRELRLPNAILLVPLTAAAVWLANTTRIALLVLIGARLSPAIAVGGFHSKAGWVFFCVIAFGVVWMSRALPFFAKETTRAEHHGPNPTAPYLLPLIALLATMMLTGLFAHHDFDPLYVLRFVAVLAVVVALRGRYPRGTFRASATSVAWGVGIFALWLALSPHAGPAPMPASLAALPPALQGLWIAGRVLGAVVAVPIAEELAFRGFLLARLQAHEFDPARSPRFTLLSFLGSSALFALMHETEWLAALLAGMLFAAAYLRTGRLGEAMWAHAICNGLVAVWVLARGAWHFW